MTNVALPLGMISAETYEKIKNVVICDGLGAIERFVQDEASPVRDLSRLAAEVSMNTEKMVACTSIQQEVPSTFFRRIQAVVKNKMITAFCELEREYGCLDKLTIDITKHRRAKVISNNNTINEAVLNVSIQEVPKEPWYSKITWKVIIPIIITIVGAVVGALLLRFLGL